MRRHHSLIVLVAACVVALDASGAVAQPSALATLPEEPPKVVLYRFGPVLVNPRLTVPEIGHDSNAFNDALEPKGDFVIRITPEIDFFTDAGLLRFAVKSSTAFTYYHRFDSERSIAEQVRGRMTARFSRLRPWVGGASIRSNERTTEIDERATRSDREVAGGVQFDVSPVAALTVSAGRTAVSYAGGEEYRGTPLAPALDRTSTLVSAALRFEATPFTTVTFSGYGGRDDFAFALMRDADIRGGDVELSFSPEAVIRGRLGLGFRQYDFDDPTVATYRGLTGRGGVTTLFAWRAILGVDYVRDLQYSFDRRDGYYVENAATIVYTQKIGGPFDAQARVGRSALNYGAGVASVPRTEVLRSFQAGLGYGLENGSRFGLSYEFAQRVGDHSDDREFSRRRVFGSFTYEFWK